jgi:hypothetical protein
MTDDTKSPGARRGEILSAEVKRAASAKNGLAICNAYVETAKKLLAENPAMSLKEKQVHHGALIQAIEVRKVRMNQDCSNVLDELARLLGVLSRSASSR